jgi:sigma-B regulation protein RsbU (phosphoserine phosphatase)
LKEVVLKDSSVLREELNRLRNEKSAFKAQSKLLEKFVSLARSPGKDKMLIKILQKTLEVFAGLTGAEKGSLFLLDRKGVVIESILTRSDATPEQRSRLIGHVLDKGLAGWVRRHREVGLIMDTKEDDRWLDLPDQPYTVRSALAVPILRDEKLLGLLTLLHTQTGHFSAETAELMKMIAGQIAIALENASLYAKLSNYSKALNAELEKGKKIQRDFLPAEIPRIPGWEINTCFHPARQVSGDFYDVFMLPGNYVGLVIADVCDKGVGSALYMALFRSLIRVFSGQIILGGWSVTKSRQDEKLPSGADVTRMLQAVPLTNDYISEEHGKDVMFATLFFGVLNPASGDLFFINGGHEPPCIIGPSGIKQTLKAKGPAVGYITGAEFEIQQAQLEYGDSLIGYTDGVTEALSPQKALFTKERFLKLIESPVASASELIERIKTDLFGHIANAPQFDDITMLAVHRKPRE